MTQKRLYVVHVEFEFPVLAESATDALDYIDDAVRDSNLENDASVELIHFGSKTGKPSLPLGYTLDALVYGCEGRKETTLAEAIVAERSIRDAESKQMSLFDGVATKA